MDFLTADGHHGHRNIIKYSKRPFSSVEEMDRVLIENINSLVKENDRLFYIGDFCTYNPRSIREQIKCKNIHLILGNHDRLRESDYSLFTNVDNLKQIKIQVRGETKELVLCHYALRVWNKSHYGVAHGYGHSHGSLYDDPNSLSMDVGVDSIANKLRIEAGLDTPLQSFYRPISTIEFFEYMNLKTFKPIDHHRGNSV